MKTNMPVRCRGTGKRGPRQNLAKDPRFRAFMEEARTGDEAAIHGLWIEYGVDYAKEGGRFE